MDDEADTRASLSEMLSYQFPGCRVVTASDGKAAIDALEENEFDLALVDYQLPRVNGMQVLEAAATVRHVPCLLLTGFAAPPIGPHAFETGLVGFVHKTSSTAQLMKAVHRIIGPIA